MYGEDTGRRQATGRDGVALFELGRPDPFREIRLVVPPLRPVPEPGLDDRDGDALLEWDAGPSGMSEPLDGLLRAYLALADGTAEQVWAFAARFGPLWWSDSTKPTGDYQDGVAYAEPISTWRRHARSLGHFLDVADALRRNDGWISGEAWFSFFPAVLIPHVLARPWGRSSKGSEHDATDLFGHLMNDHSGAWLTRDAERRGDLLDHVISAVLTHSGVRPAIARGRDGDVRAAFALPTRRIVDPFASGEGSETGDHPVWHVEGLLPVLACAIVDALDSDWWAICTRCGKLAQKKEDGRGPRRGLAWYGDHDHCRHQARLETWHRRDQRRAERRDTARGESRTDNRAEGDETASMDETGRPRS